MSSVNLISIGRHVWTSPVQDQDVDFPVAAGLADRLGGEHHVIGRASTGRGSVECAGAVVVHRLAADAPTWRFVRDAAHVTRELAHSLGAPTVILTSDVAGALVSLRNRRSTRTPVVVQVQGAVLHPGREYGAWLKRSLIGLTMRAAVRRADAIRALNPFIAGQLRALGVAAPVAVIGSRVDTHRFAPASTPSPGPPRIGAVGGLVPVKNHDVLLRALAELSADAPTTELVIVGDGPLRSQLDERARALGIGDRITFCGAIPHSQVPDVLRSLTVFAQPSRSEGEPRAVLEAQAVALPVVVSDIPAHHAVVSDARTGLLVTVDDPAAWATAFRKLSSDRELAAALGAAGREQACNEHDFDALLDRFADFIRSAAVAAG